MLTAETYDKLDQGTILHGIHHPISSSLNISVALNPTCLFHNNKADSVILAYLIPADFILERNEEFQQHAAKLEETVREGTEEASKGKSKSIRKAIGKLIDNDEPRRYFYLRGLKQIGLPDSFIDFQQITSLPFEQVHENSKILARIKTPWREKLATHYAGYMMRIGVDRFEGEFREQVISEMIAPIQLASAP